MGNNERYAPIKLEGGAFYRSIKSIEFTPVQEGKKMEVAVPKGKIYFWKLWGIIPLIPLHAKHNLYKASGRMCRFAKLKDAAESKYGWHHYFLKNDTVYFKAEVDVYCSDYNNNVHKRFTSNEAAMQYFNEVKEKCKKYENYLN